MMLTEPFSLDKMKDIYLSRGGMTHGKWMYSVEIGIPYVQHNGTIYITGCLTYDFN